MLLKFINKLKNWHFWFSVNKSKLTVNLLPKEIDSILNNVEMAYIWKKDGKTYLLTVEGFPIELVPSKEVYLEKEKCYQRIPLK